MVLLAQMLLPQAPQVLTAPQDGVAQTVLQGQMVLLVLQELIEPQDGMVLMVPLEFQVLLVYLLLVPQVLAVVHLTTNQTI
jgi:hypothetical protein